MTLCDPASFQQNQQAAAAKPGTVAQIHMPKWEKRGFSDSWPAEPEMAGNTLSQLVKCIQMQAGTEEAPWQADLRYWNEQQNAQGKC